MRESRESSPRYIQYPETENVLNYCKGGYHPVHIGDIFHNRYRVINKLGYGSYGTVWLVEDLSLKRYVALKVLAASDPASESTKSYEIDVVRHLMLQQQRLPSIAGAEYVMKIFEEFEIEGPNGIHHCIVTELLGPCVGHDEIEDVHDGHPPPLAYLKKIAAQIARGVAYLHKCGVVHGDLHAGNVLLYDPGMEHWSLQELEHYFGKPCKGALARHDGMPITNRPESLPEYLVASPQSHILLEHYFSSLNLIHVKICDFGEAFLTTTACPKTHLRTPTVYAAPEILFPEPPTPIGPPTDIWALAVLLHMVLSSNFPLFCSSHGIENEVIREMVLTLGKLPERWWTRWSERAEYFDEDGTFIGDKSELPGASGKFLKIYGMREDELETFESLLRQMVRYEVQDRISAEKVVELIPASWINGL